MRLGWADQIVSRLDVQVKNKDHRVITLGGHVSWADRVRLHGFEESSHSKLALSLGVQLVVPASRPWRGTIFHGFLRLAGFSQTGETEKQREVQGAPTTSNTC